MRQLDSPTPSPERKRQRLSSPLYEESIDLLSKEDLAGIDALESKYLQSISDISQSSDDSTNAKTDLRAPDIPNADDTRNPFLSALPSFTSASLLHPRPEAVGSGDLQNDLDSSDKLESEPTYDSWFQTASTPQFPGFQAASGTRDLAGSTTALGFASAGAGFITAGKKSIYAPSKAALAAAQAKIEAIWNDEAEERSDSTQSSSQIAGDVFSNLALHKRPALRAVENGFHLPRTPSHSTMSSKNLGVSPFSPLLERSKDKGKGKARVIEGIENVHCSSSDPTDSHIATPSSLAKSRQFVSPLITRPALRLGAVECSPTVASHNKHHPTFTSATSQLPASFVTPRRILPMTGEVKPYPTVGIKEGTINRTFITPFKPGIRPEKLGNSIRKNALGEMSCQSKIIAVHSPSGKRRYQSFFQLTPPVNRVKLKSSGLLPQLYEVDDLDVSLIELTQIIPSLAPFYSFNTSPDADNPRNAVNRLGAAAAFDELKSHGCVLATKPWVNNHWSLILWKLSGMALLAPHQEKDLAKRKWCWSEVMRQFLYRYERELNQGKRPALRMISTQDASPVCPMVLCVSDIFWTERGRTTDGLTTDRVPELEVTDGWYRLRAVVDPPMARAIGRGIIRIGRKIGVAGARLSSEKKEPSEVLEAYDSVKLLLSGNSSHLMPWHAKLGFQQNPFISTLHSLTTDGGCIAVLDVVVTKTYPIAYFEFFEDGDQRRREGPRSEGEEIKLHDTWKRRREREAAKLRSELEKRFHRLGSYAGRLMRQAGTQFDPSDYGSPPDSLDELYDLLEDSTEANATIPRLDPVEAGWLAKHISASVEKERARADEDIERDLQRSCPPREVRSFRVVVVQDACTRRRPANRVAQITVWDVPGLSEEESSKSIFQVGQRYLTTNLIPTQQSAWMDYEPGSQVFLSTRRDSRWIRLQ